MPWIVWDICVLHAPSLSRPLYIDLRGPLSERLQVIKDAIRECEAKSVFTHAPSKTSSKMGQKVRGKDRRKPAEKKRKKDNKKTE
jgi:hypothetical protein